MKNLVYLLLMSALGHVQSQAGSLNFKIIEKFSMETPITNKEFENWQTEGASVFLKNEIVLVPELKDRKGAIWNKFHTAKTDEWLIEMRVKIGNEMRTAKGGAGLGIHYLQEINQSQIGTGLFGYSKQFNGLAVYLNSILSTYDESSYVNYVQAFVNDGTKQVNAMKLKGPDTKNCKAVFRNIYQANDDKGFRLRIQYKNPTTTISIEQGDQLVPCISIDQELAPEGAILITGASGLSTSDHILIQEFTYFDMSQKVAESANQRYHESHKKKAIHDMAQFDHEHHAKDLLHKKGSFFNKEQFGEEALYDMLPAQLGMTKQLMSDALNEMYTNLNYYYKITAPLHNHKTYDQQMQNVNWIQGNMTMLSAEMDGVKSRFDQHEVTLFAHADEQFKQQDKVINMNEGQKDDLWQDAISEIERAMKLMHKKFGALGDKISSLTEFETHFHDATDKMEKQYQRDNESRRKYYQEHDHVVAKQGPLVDLSSIDEIFDALEKEEGQTTLMILLKIPNLCMLGVIIMSIYLWITLQKLGSKQRHD